MSDRKTLMRFLIINFDGFDVGVREDFADTRLNFDDFYDAFYIALHWSNWIDGQEFVE